MERTLTAQPGLFLQSQPGGGPKVAKAPFSSSLGGLVRSITALTSKHEEEKLIQQELSSLKATVSAPTTTLKMMKECMLLGEYSYLLDTEKPEDVIKRLCKLLMSDSISSETKAWLIAAVTKLTAQAQASDTVERIMQEFTISLDTCMRQHTFELKHLRENVEVMKSLLPVNKSCEDVVVHASLSFLDDYVAEGLSQGAEPYKPHHQRQEEKLSQEKVLNFEPYGLSFSSSGFTGPQSPAGISLGSDISGNSAEAGLKETNNLKLDGVKKLWGKEGYLPQKESAARDGAEAPPLPPEVWAAENIDKAAAKRSQAQVLAPSKEEKEKQLLASSLFVGLGSESIINLLGKPDFISHKFRRKSKVKAAKSGEAASTHNLTCSSLNSLSQAAYEENDYLTALRDGEDVESKDLPLGPELSDSESLSELPLAEKVSDCSLSAPSLFADSDMEIFQPPSFAVASLTRDITSASCLLEETTGDMCSGRMEVCSDETVSVSSYKLWKDDCLLMVWSVTSKSGSQLKGADLDIFPAQNFKISEQSGCCLPVMEAGSTKNFQYSLQMEKPFTEENLSGFVNYQMVDTHSVQLEFSVNLSLLDFIRPLKISTEDFGKLWLSFVNDVKQNIKISEPQAALPSALKTLQQKLRLHVVGIQRSEGLLACWLLPSTSSLLHYRVHADGLPLWFRSFCPALPDYLSYQCQKVMMLAFQPPPLLLVPRVPSPAAALTVERSGSHSAAGTEQPVVQTVPGASVYPGSLRRGQVSIMGSDAHNVWQLPGGVTACSRVAAVTVVRRAWSTQLSSGRRCALVSGPGLGAQFWVSHREHDIAFVLSEPTNQK
ncbi:LOW QUALITY PROTEIN: AP-4 complex subunit epsilon-1-like [Heterocephalus glaber]|uniref:LOW QUALITY PROTEIN: AP-4 complex subunit epsilon-1-like n=1 Tax=Heterocephalus glaber TaxID=10181 RepID=A0AAX6RUA6_HETGA|nr:LOW QUALITY PROTEIN: AP-4 complex subunit epsilon-1-like [Heterocephalus glaber]